MGRKPTARRRWASHGGEGLTVSPPMTRAAYRGHRSGSRISTAASEAASVSPSRTVIWGKRNGARVRAATSRATPTIDSASGRFGVISISRMVSSRPRYWMRAAPRGASAASSRMPSSSSPMPSSFSEQSSPSDTVPRILAALMARPPGSVAPGGANAVRRPGAAFGAPQITEKVLPGAATRQRRMWWPAAVTPRSRSMASISPTTTPESPSTRGDREATSMPALVSRSAICAGV